MKKELPDGWKEIFLIDILKTIENGNRPKGGIIDLDEGIPSLGGEHLNSSGGFNFDKIKLIPNEFYENLKRGKIEKGDVLVVKDGATTGKTSLVDNNFPYKKAAVNEHVFILRCKTEQILQKYLFYHLRSQYGQIQIQKNFHGAAIGGINTQFAKNYKLILPSLKIQHEIVSILEKADETRKLRTQADELTQQLLQSVFLDMFGDPITNEKKWGIKALENTCLEIYRYPTFYGFDYIENGTPIVRIMNILSNGSIDPNLSNYVFFDSALNKEFPRTILEFNDIVMAVRGDGSTAKRIGIINSQNLVGANISPNVIRIKTDKKILNPVYLFYFMTSNRGQAILNKSVTRTAKKNITAGNIKKIQVPVPTIQLQNKFAKIVEKVDNIKNNQQQSSQEINTLFNALMQKAFTGELVS